MSAGLIDDQIHNDPRFISAGPTACGAWLMWLSYLRQTKSTTGVIPLAVAQQKWGSKPVVAALTAGGDDAIVHVVEGGLYLSGYRRIYTEADAKREAIAEARSEFGRRGAQSRWHKPSKPMALAIEHGITLPWQTNAPHTTTTESLSVPSVPHPRKSGDVALMVEVWNQRKGTRQPSLKLLNDRTLKRNLEAMSERLREAVEGTAIEPSEVWEQMVRNHAADPFLNGDDPRGQPRGITTLLVADKRSERIGAALDRLTAPVRTGHKPLGAEERSALMEANERQQAEERALMLHPARTG